MKFNKKKFFKNLFFFVLFITICALVFYLWSFPEAWENTYSYYADLFSGVNKEELIDVKEVFSISYDPAVQTSITPGKDGILVVNKNGIYEYTTSKNPIWVNEMKISNPIIAVKGNRFVIAESGGKKLSSFQNKTKLWDYELPNEIKKITVNKDGFVGAVFSQVGYKSGFVFISPDGKELYKKLFAKTNLIDIDISPKGNLVAMIEADPSSATINSAVSLMSDKGQIVYSEIEADVLLSGIRFVDNSNVVSVGDNRIIKIDKDYKKTVLDNFSEQNVSGINLENEGKIIKIYRAVTSVFANKSTIDIFNVNYKKTGTGEVAGVVKSVESSGKTIAVVLADRVDFFDISGKYLNSLNISGKYKSMKLFSSGDYACIDLTDTIKVVRVR